MNDKILAVLEKVSKVVPGRLITRENDLPYLFRYYLSHADSGDAAVFLHKFVNNDKLGELHSHPWESSLSIILSGRYIEHRARGLKQPDGRVHIGTRVARVYGPGNLNYIEDDDFHRIELVDKEVWTLFIHGKRVKDWGFVREEYDSVHEIRVITERTFDKNPEVNRPEVKITTTDKIRQPMGKHDDRQLVKCEMPGVTTCHYEEETCTICRDPDITRKIRL